MSKDFQQAARSAFSGEDWFVLMQDPIQHQSYSELGCIADVEKFVFAGYDQVRSWREQQGEARPDGACGVARG